MEEIKKVLEGFEKEKIPGPNGWVVDFFLEFFDMLCKEVLVVVEESILKGMACGAINATFVTMIPKKYKLETYQDFKPIAFCNLVYKMIKNIIANIINPTLPKIMSKKQFSFLDNRQIVEAIGVAQEDLHSIKVKKLEYVVLKLDLIKDYDKVK